MRSNHVTEYIGIITGQAEEGELNPLQAYAELIEIGKLASEAAAQIKAAAMSEVANHMDKDSGDFTFKGYKFSKRNGRALWDFSHIPSHVSTKAALADIEETAKRAFELAQKGGNMADENGEVIQPAIFKGYAESSLSAKPIEEK